MEERKFCCKQIYFFCFSWLSESSPAPKLSKTSVLYSITTVCSSYVGEIWPPIPRPINESSARFCPYSWPFCSCRLNLCDCDNKHFHNVDRSYNRTHERCIVGENSKYYGMRFDRGLQNFGFLMIAQSQLIADDRDDRRRWQEIEHGSIFCNRLRSWSQDRRSMFPYDRRRSQTLGKIRWITAWL